MAETGYQLTGDAAQAYELYNVTRVSSSFAKAMCEKVPLYAGDRLLDAACGTGIVTRVALERYEHLASIIGTDFNEKMLEVARASAPITEIPIEWRQGDLCDLPFPNDSFDIVLCGQGLQFVPDKSAALGHIRRVLTLEGRLAFSVWSKPWPLAAVSSDAITRHINKEAGAGMLAPYALADRDALVQLVDHAGFKSIEISDLSITIRWPATLEGMKEHMITIIGRSPFASEITAAQTLIIEDIMLSMKSYREGDEFVMPGNAHLVQARAS